MSETATMWKKNRTDERMVDCGCWCCVVDSNRVVVLCWAESSRVVWYGMAKEERVNMGEKQQQKSHKLEYEIHNKVVLKGAKRSKVKWSGVSAQHRERVCDNVTKCKVKYGDDQNETKQQLNQTEPNQQIKSQGNTVKVVKLNGKWRWWWWMWWWWW